MNTGIKLHEFIRKAIVIHGYIFDYSKVVYINDKTKVKIICPKHGEFEQTPSNHLRCNGCPKCSYDKLSILKRSTLEEFIVKSKLLYGNKFDYFKTKYLNSYTKLIITCPIHGDFKQFPFDHLKGQGCPKCSYDKLSLKFRNTNNEFIEKAKKVHNDKYVYSKVIYINAKTKVYITCPKHGDFKQLPYVHLKGHGCPVCKSSKGELAIKAILDKHNITVEPQYRLPDEKYLFKYDFYLTELNILIEFHGIQHYEWIPYFHKTYGDFQEQQRRDIHKIDLAKMKNIPLLEFNYNQFKHMTEQQFEQFVINSVLNIHKHS